MRSLCEGRGGAGAFVAPVLVSACWKQPVRDASPPTTPPAHAEGRTTAAGLRPDAPVLTPDLPRDVTQRPITQQAVNEFAWQMFVAMNWPARPRWTRHARWWHSTSSPCFPRRASEIPRGLPPGALCPQGFDAPRRQANLGPVELALIPPGGTMGQARTLGLIDHGLEDYSRYEDQGGIAEVSYASAQVSDEDLRNGTLIIRGTADSSINPGALFVSEVPVRVVSDERAVYLRSSQEAQLTLHVTERDQPPGRDILLYVHQTIGRASDREDGGHFYSTAYMPISRSLSPGKVGLLRRWLRKVSPGAQGNFQ